MLQSYSEISLFEVVLYKSDYINHIDIQSIPSLFFSHKFALSVCSACSSCSARSRVPPLSFVTCSAGRWPFKTYQACDLYVVINEGAFFQAPALSKTLFVPASNVNLLSLLSLHSAIV